MQCSCSFACRAERKRLRARERDVCFWLSSSQSSPPFRLFLFALSISNLRKPSVLVSPPQHFHFDSLFSFSLSHLPFLSFLLSHICHLSLPLDLLVTFCLSLFSLLFASIQTLLLSQCVNCLGYLLSLLGLRNNQFGQISPSVALVSTVIGQAGSLFQSSNHYCAVFLSFPPNFQSELLLDYYHYC